MPRVYRQKKSARGAKRTCGRCGREIKPGEEYMQWSFRYGGTRFACKDHPPRQSELTQSKMSAVYAAIESVEDSLPGCGSVEEVNALVQAAADEVREVAEEYSEAAEAMGAAGESSESRERADTLEEAASELESWEADVEEADDDEESSNGRVTVEVEEWAAMLRERGADPADFKAADPISRAKAFEMFDMDVGELGLRVDARMAEQDGDNEDDTEDAVESAREQAQEHVTSIDLP